MGFTIITPAAVSDRWNLAVANNGQPANFLLHDAGSKTVVIQLDGGFPFAPWHPRLKRQQPGAPLPYEHGGTVPDTFEKQLTGAFLHPVDNLFGYENPTRVFVHNTRDMYSGTKTQPDYIDGKLWTFAGAHVVRAVCEYLRDEVGINDYDAETRVLLCGISGGALGVQQTAHIAAQVWPGLTASGRLRLVMDSGAFYSPPEGWRVPTTTVIKLRSFAWAVNHLSRLYGSDLNPAAVARAKAAGKSNHHALVTDYAVPALVEDMGLPLFVLQAGWDSAYQSLYDGGPGGGLAWRNATVARLKMVYLRGPYALWMPLLVAHGLSNDPAMTLDDFGDERTYRLSAVARQWWNDPQPARHIGSPYRTYSVPNLDALIGRAA